MSELQVTITIPKGKYCGSCVLRHDYVCAYFRKSLECVETAPPEYVSTYRSGDMSDNTGYTVYHNNFKKCDRCKTKEYEDE